MKKIIFIFLAVFILMFLGCSIKKTEPIQKIHIIQNYEEQNKSSNENKADFELQNSTENIAEEKCDDSCLKEKSVLLQNPLLCKNITNTDIKNLCYFEIAANKNDTAACNKISSAQLRDVCLQKLGVKKETKIDTNIQMSTTKSTFLKTNEEICRSNGKPIVRAFGASWCPHCRWMFPIFMSVAKEYEDKGLIKAYAWEINTGNDLLTPELETAMPKEEIDFYYKNDPKLMVPYLNFGCLYQRIGTGYESGNDVAAEEAEYRQVLDELIAQK